MRRVNIDKVNLGSVLSKPVYKPGGGILLSEGSILSQSYIYRLKTFGVNELYIEDEISKGIVIQNTIEDETRNDAIKHLKKTLDGYLKHTTLNVERLSRTIDRIADELLSKDDIILNLTSIKTIDGYTFEHSVNVCVISLVIGICLGYNNKKLRELGMGSMLHDIGKIMIPDSILKKPAPLTVTEFEEVKKHTIYGYEILKKTGKLSLISAFIAFGHHERYDGTGYPFQLKGENIHKGARIVAIADVYDALSSDRSFRKRLKDNEVFEYMTTYGASGFDPIALESFVKHIDIYPVGSGVILNTNEIGIITQRNPNYPTRPLVRIITGKDGKSLRQYREIDLSEDFSRYVVDCCEI